MSTETKEKKPRSALSALLACIMGIVLVVLSVVLLLMNIRVVTFGFFRIMGMDTAPILMIVLVLLIVWAVISKKAFPWIFVGVDILLIIVSVIAGTKFMFAQINAFTLIIMLGMFAVGVALILGNVFFFKKHKNELFE